MPLPVGHSLAGYLIYLGVERETSFRQWKIILLYVICANLPDLDFLPGFLVGQPNLYHHGISHSLGLAVLLALMAGIYLCWRRKRPALKIFGIVFGLYFGHVLLDCLSVDKRPPFGVQLLWPLTSRYFLSPLLIFPPVYKADTSRAFLGSLVHIGNLKLIAVEVLIFVPLVMAVRLWIRRAGAGQWRSISAR